jgi:acyl-CoA reductase-like NAD-dependent aldehyde dehydrogenase
LIFAPERGQLHSVAPESTSGTDRAALEESAQKVARAFAALPAMRSLTQGDVDRIVAAMARAAVPEAGRLAELAHRETGFGNVSDKTVKNLFSAERVASHIAPMKTVGMLRDDPVTGITEFGEPMGVVAAVVPSTNPTSTAIFKVLVAVKARCPRSRPAPGTEWPLRAGRSPGLRSRGCETTRSHTAERRDEG